MENRPRILICDDDPLMTDSIKAILSTGNYHLETTNCPRHALTLIHAESPDVVILDIMMPEMSGFEVIDAVDRDHCDPAFIIVTGQGSIDSAIRSIRKGASDYVRKPFEPDELIIRLENVLKQRQLNNDHRCVEAEKRQLQNQLRQSQKMEAIGTLAGGIAHDFNNVLSIILGNTELALADMPSDLPVHRNLERIFTASLRAREMIQQLLSFSRKEGAGCKPLRFNSVITESLKLMRASLPTNITIERHICENDCTIIADATQIHQVMLNLCTNAAHAMEPNGGILTIRLEGVTLDSTATDVDGLSPGDYARLVVADTGHGIEKNIIDRIFDPYFTTKETGKGTGMGLSVVHGIVKGNGGAIRVFSQPGRFTEFHLYLPLVNAVIDAEPAIFDRQQLPGGHEHILIVDDEEMLVEMMRQVLEQLGYAVTAYTDSTTALKSFLNCPGAYDLLITDMTMPWMKGTDLARAVKGVKADLPVILCTGYNEQISQDNAESLGIQALIMKPVGMQQLAETIRNVLAPPSMDRRKHPRYAVPSETFVISGIHPYPRSYLVDIGISGLAFCHEMQSAPNHPSEQLTILTPDGEIVISAVPCRVVSDIPAGRGLTRPETGLARRSVRFKGLTDRQTERINRFIRRHTTALLN
ncbi:MAG: response regulator [Desulfosarcina sp.]